MSNIAIKVENLGKKYVINHETGNGDDNFREVVIGTTKKIISTVNPFNKSKTEKPVDTTEDFWALNDVNFTINKGDKVGIIGRNGAGKSTLLKVLSRITEPTTGKIHINGRIASLLEVGTGFHPELTGRENIYLNGAILGMSRKEIKKKFDEIVAFAEVERFLDIPVKRYSSGMYVRLAFSVAAHLEPEILIVDEVLAVGDIEFQKKCLGKMQDVSDDGRTILFVSHNMAAIQKLCSKAIFMESGRLQYVGDVEETLDKYLCHVPTGVTKRALSELPRTKGLGIDFKLDSFKFYNSKMEESETFMFGEVFYVEMVGISQKSLKGLQLVVGINSQHGDRIATTISAHNQIIVLESGNLVKGLVEIHECFVPGQYNITLTVRQNEKNVIDKLSQIGSFIVDTIKDPKYLNEVYIPGGYIHMPDAIWKIEEDINGS